MAISLLAMDALYGRGKFGAIAGTREGDGTQEEADPDPGGVLAKDAKDAKGLVRYPGAYSEMM